jgi:hypothetical protein
MFFELFVGFNMTSNLRPFHNIALIAHYILWLQFLKLKIQYSKTVSKTDSKEAPTLKNCTFFWFRPQSKHDTQPAAARAAPRALAAAAG